jgi:hypothetical protein
VKRIVVYHRGFGCESGCCGHSIAFAPDDWPEPGDDWPHFDLDEEKFTFDHPYSEDHLEFAKRVISEELGAEHVADLDWNNCAISED